MKTINQLKTIVLVTTLVFAAGCGKDKPSFSLAPDAKTFTQKSSFNNQIDILFVVDNSGSMQPYQQNLVNNFNAFISNFISKGYDFKIAVTTTEAYLASNRFLNDPTLAQFKDGSDYGGPHSGVRVISPVTPNVVNTFVTNASQGTLGSGDERAFSSMKAALNSSMNTGFLRPTAFLAVIILSDEDDFSGDNRAEGVNDHNYGAATLDTVASYVTYLDTLTASSGATRRYNVSSIAVVDAACQAAHSLSVMGTRYQQLSVSTDGVVGSICDANFSTTLNAIQTKISELSTRFTLDRTPIVSSIRVIVNGMNVSSDPNNGWTYDAASNSIVFHGAATPAQGASIQVLFDPATIK